MAYIHNPISCSLAVALGTEVLQSYSVVASAGNCCRLDVFLSRGPELPVIGQDKCLLGNHRNGTGTLLSQDEDYCDDDTNEIYNEDDCVFLLLVVQSCP